MGVPSFRESFEYHSRVVQIVGGNQAEPNEFPYQVQLQYDGNFFCGGTILNTLFILTAAHCVKYKNASNIVVTGGDHHRFYDEGQEQERNVSYVFIHEDYNWDTNLNDIALLALSTPFEFNEFVSAIDYPRKVMEFQGMGVVSGWGRLSDRSAMHNVLQKVEVPIVRHSECATRYIRQEMTIAPSMLCAGVTGKDACEGDSGGPLTCRIDGSHKPVVCGIVSHGFGCGRENYPGVYSDVSYFSKWIDGILGTYAPSDKNLSCGPRKFQCKSGHCLTIKWKCNGELDCPDGDDETNCPTSGPSTTTSHPLKSNSICADTEFNCPTRFGSGYCIPIALKCDGKLNCVHGEDEKDCSKWVIRIPTISTSITPTTTSTTSTTTTTRRPEICTDKEFRCRSGNFIGGFCLPVLFKCDGDPDWIHGEDEDGCSSLEHFGVRNNLTIIPPTIWTRLLSPTTEKTVVKKCDKNQFQCLRSKDCISQTLVCDMKNDCEDGSDEAECVRSTTCHSLEWRCQNGECIYHRFRCDNDLDCTDHSDEDGCSQNKYFTMRF